MERPRPRADEQDERLLARAVARDLGWPRELGCAATWPFEQIDTIPAGHRDPMVEAVRQVLEREVDPQVDSLIARARERLGAEVRTA